MNSRVVLGALMLALLPGVAFAYGGPGSGLSAIGSALSVFAAIGFAIVGFVWYPVKRAIGMFRRRRPEEAQD